MKVAILIFLIINALIIGLLVVSCIYTIMEERTKTMKRCGALENENKALASQSRWFNKRLEDYKKKYPLKAKYGLLDRVVCVVKDKVFNGVIRVVNLYENEVVKYQIELLNNKDKTVSNLVEVYESDVYPENTLGGTDNGK